MASPYSEHSEFCALCTGYLPLEQLRARRKWSEESGDFEVEWVVDYDRGDNEYFVKWKGYPMAAICKTEVAASFIAAVRSFWANPQNQPIPRRAQRDIDALNVPEHDADFKMSSLDIGCTL